MTIFLWVRRYPTNRFKNPLVYYYYLLKPHNPTVLICTRLIVIYVLAIIILAGYSKLKSLSSSDVVTFETKTAQSAQPRVLFRERPCPTIDTTKRQILLLNVGSVRSFIYPTTQQYYHKHQIGAIQNTSNAQIHQIWYFSLSDSTLHNKHATHAEVDFPTVNMTELRDLQLNYDVFAVFEQYNSSEPIPKHYQMMIKQLPSAFIQAYRLQLAFETALEYANTCGVEWTHLIRTRPDYICTSPVQLDLSQYDELESRYIIHDNSWNFKVADFFYVFDRAAALSVITNFTENYSELVGDTAEEFFHSLLSHHGVALIPNSFTMCALGRSDHIECGARRVKDVPILCQNDIEYIKDAYRMSVDANLLDSYCDSCIWKGRKMSCHKRVLYLRQHYSLGLNDSIASAMDDPSCRKA